MEYDIPALDDIWLTYRKLGLILCDKNLGSSEHRVIVGIDRGKMEESNVVLFARYFNIVNIQDERVLGDLDVVKSLIGNPTRVNE